MNRFAGGELYPKVLETLYFTTQRLRQEWFTILNNAQMKSNVSSPFDNNDNFTKFATLICNTSGTDYEACIATCNSWFECEHVQDIEDITVDHVT